MFVIAGGLFLIFVCLDMGIKQHIEETFHENEERETIINKVVLRKVYNRGFLLNSLDKYPAVVKTGSAVVGIAVAGYDVWLFLRKGRFLEKAGMILVSAGAVSNIYDRLIRGKVIDYIGVNCKNKFLSRITANLADVYVIVGVVAATAGKWINKR